MKPRHAAALAFVGWYLMVPPASDFAKWQRRFRVRPGIFSFGFDAALLPRWKKLGKFDSQATCERNRELVIHRDGIATGQSVHNAEQYQANHAECIASDDPRLKEK